MARFEVNSNDLRGVSDKFSQARGISPSVESMDVNEDTWGSSDMAYAVNSFRERWGVGVTDVNKTLDEASTQLTDAAQNYENLESAVVRSYSGMGGR